MPIRTSCPHCGRPFYAPDKSEGFRANCPGCRQWFVLWATQPPGPRGGSPAKGVGVGLMPALARTPVALIGGGVLAVFLGCCGCLGVGSWMKSEAPSEVAAKPAGGPDARPGQPPPPPAAEKPAAPEKPAAKPPEKPPAKPDAPTKPTPPDEAKAVREYNEAAAKAAEERRRREEAERAEAARKAAEELNVNGLVLLRKTVKDVHGGDITGTVVNRRDKKLRYAQITFTLYDRSGAQVGTAIANINDLEPGARWNFRAYSFGKDFDRYKFSELTGF